MNPPRFLIHEPGVSCALYAHRRKRPTLLQVFQDTPSGHAACRKCLALHPTSELLVFSPALESRYQIDRLPPISRHERHAFMQHRLGQFIDSRHPGRIDLLSTPGRKPADALLLCGLTSAPLPDWLPDNKAIAITTPDLLLPRLLTQAGFGTQPILLSWSSDRMLCQYAVLEGHTISARMLPGTTTEELVLRENHLFADYLGEMPALAHPVAWQSIHVGANAPAHCRALSLEDFCRLLALPGDGLTLTGFWAALLARQPDVPALRNADSRRLHRLEQWQRRIRGVMTGAGALAYGVAATLAVSAPAMPVSAPRNTPVIPDVSQHPDGLSGPDLARLTEQWRGMPGDGLDRLSHDLVRISETMTACRDLELRELTWHNRADSTLIDLAGNMPGPLPAGMACQRDWQEALTPRFELLPGSRLPYTRDQGMFPALASSSSESQAFTLSLRPRTAP